VPLVAVDSMIIDLLDENLHVEPDIAEAIEALEPPPISLSPPAYAVYWLVALAPFWPSCLYTFSDTLYQELAQMPVSKQRKAERLFSVAMSIRETHSDAIDETQIPHAVDFVALGLEEKDAQHVADAVCIGATHFLTRDKKLLARAALIEKTWHIRIMSPEVFLLTSVKSGAPWPSRVPWPWEHGPLQEAAIALGIGQSS
jgi:predicted nucleic acid-binding protein